MISIHVREVARRALPPVFEVVSSDGIVHARSVDLRAMVLALRRIAKAKGYTEGLVAVEQRTLAKQTRAGQE